MCKYIYIIYIYNYIYIFIYVHLYVYTNPSLSLYLSREVYRVAELADSDSEEVPRHAAIGNGAIEATRMNGIYVLYVYIPI